MKDKIKRISKNVIQSVFDRVVNTYEVRDDSVWDSITLRFDNEYLGIERGWKNDYSLAVIDEEGEYNYFEGGKGLVGKDFYYYLRGMADAQKVIDWRDKE